MNQPGGSVSYLKKSAKLEELKNLSFRSVLHYQSFGDLNKDVTFLVIQQAGNGRGIFSLLSSILCWLDVAERYGFIPVIDFENFKCEYNEATKIEDTNNAFEYYFQPVSKYSLDEVYKSSRVIITNNHFPDGYNFSVTTIPKLKFIYNKYIKIRDEILYDSKLKAFGNGNLPIIGVHYRGREMRRAGGHWYPPSNRQIAKSIELLLLHKHFEKIFVCTEDLNCLEFLKKEFSDLIIAHDNFRTRRENAYKIYPRKLHKYLLGREVLVDMLTLSQCSALVGCTSNVVEMARFVGADNIDIQIKINNGINKWRGPLAELAWNAKNLLPQKYGGFKIDSNTLQVRKKHEHI